MKQVSVGRVPVLTAPLSIEHQYGGARSVVDAVHPCVLAQSSAVVGAVKPVPDPMTKTQDENVSLIPVPVKTAAKVATVVPRTQDENMPLAAVAPVKIMTSTAAKVATVLSKTQDENPVAVPVKTAAKVALAMTKPSDENTPLAPAHP